MTDVQPTTDTELPAEETGRPGTRSTRRFVLLGAGAAGATAVLAACGTSNSGNTNGEDFSDEPAPAGSAGADGSASGGDSGGGDSGGGDSGGGGGALALVADVPEGGGVIKGDLVITQPTAGTFKAFSKVCTHAGCDVSKVDAGVITCPCHNSKFSIETGEPTAGPANKALAETKVVVDGDNIVKA
ncbi:Rieske (2Fe-2S) protein [Paractinoplanes rishiriensis]|uniref:Cytochrome bc1 complex Rieske iron-sulfur subunit n=1 Tax=Paractinoplanes rishiriensis TaxID=1050105 RepID=A0A919JY29_9ACTN|nr:Rieske (2Fe-2S) protein [Actinoplanes rishiriensis]GIE96990.1 iron-sulfur protein [Actinoplanes rishiriensis]